MYTNFVGYFPSFANYFSSMTGYLAGLFGVHHAVQIPNAPTATAQSEQQQDAFVQPPAIPPYILKGFTSDEQMANARRFAGTLPTEDGGWTGVSQERWSEVVNQQF